MAKKDEPEAVDAALRRLGGGRWQTRDERFTIEPQSGTWVIVDAEQTDDLGLPRVRGPYPSLRAAREAIGSARTAEPDASPLADRIASHARKEPSKAASQKSGRSGARAGRARRGTEAEEPPAPPEPAWLARLAEPRRQEARRLIRDLEAADLPDPVGLARRQVVDDEPAVARALLVRRIAGLVLERKAEGVAGAADLATDVVSWLTTRTRDPDAPLRLPGWRLVEESERSQRIEIRRRDLTDEIARLERRAGETRRPRR
jgi:hypothetical protein